MSNEFETRWRWGSEGMNFAQHACMKKKKFVIAQKLVQTDYYTVEAETKEEALRLYESSTGDVRSDGSSGGWKYGGRRSVVVTEPEPSPADKDET